MMFSPLFKVRGVAIKATLVIDSQKIELTHIFDKSVGRMVDLESMKVIREELIKDLKDGKPNYSRQIYTERPEWYTLRELTVLVGEFTEIIQKMDSTQEV